MLQFSKWQAAFILGIIALGALFAAPNLIPPERLQSLPGVVPKSTVNLGLDLRGGSYLLLGVNTEKVLDDRMRGIMQDIRRQMRPSRAANRERIPVESITYNATTDVIIVRVRDEARVDDAAKRIRDVTREGIGGALGFGQRTYTVTVEGARIDIAMTPDAQRLYADQAVQDSIEVVRRRIDPAGNKEVLIQPQGGDRIVIQVPGDNDPEALKELINRTGQLSFHRVDATVDLNDAQAGLLPPGRMVVPLTESEGGGFMVLYEDAEVTGDMVINASASINQDMGGFQINFTFDGRGARRFGDYTKNHVGEFFAIVLDDQIISAPRIQTPITQGSGRITGAFSAEEATRIATLIRSGALPAELTTLRQRSVSASLGADSVRAGTLALIIGFSAVIVYMVLSYGRFGIYADLALIANLVLIAGALSLLGSTLTLPGIAGVVLTIGMAVDANVLIFERIREELYLGKGPISAVETGYSRAWSAIVDANVTTFFAASIMFLLGAGPVRGFAITLAIGVTTSVFTAYVLTRLFAGSYLLAKRPKTLTL